MCGVELVAKAPTPGIKGRERHSDASPTPPFLVVFMLYLKPPFTSDELSFYLLFAICAVSPNFALIGKQSQIVIGYPCAVFCTPRTAAAQITELSFIYL